MYSTHDHAGLSISRGRSLCSGALTAAALIADSSLNAATDPPDVPAEHSFAPNPDFLRSWRALRSGFKIHN